MVKKITVSILIVLQWYISFAQSPLSTDSSVRVYPHWKKGESHSVKILSSTEEFANGIDHKYNTSFNSKFTIIDKDTSGYTLDWTYTQVNLDPNDPTLENVLLAKLRDNHFSIKITLTGKFIQLLNYKEIQPALDNTLEKLIAESEGNSRMNLRYKGTKPLLNNQKAVEAALLKHVKAYIFSFGYNYKMNFVQTNNIEFPNPFGGQIIDAVEKVQLTSLDPSSHTCIIETNKVMDEVVLKKELVNYMVRNFNKNSKDIEEAFKDKNLEFTEKTSQKIDFSRGILLKSSYTRVLNLEVQKRTNVLEMETLD